MINNLLIKLNLIFGSIGKVFGVNQIIQQKIFTSFLVVLVLLFIKKIFNKLGSSYFKTIKSKYQYKKTSKYIIYILSTLLIGRVWFEGIQSLSTILGLVSAGIAVALKDPLINIAGWFFILWQKPFEAGDRIETGETKGDVIDQNLFHFTVLEVGNWVEDEQSTGRVVHIPNGYIFNKQLYNYNKGFNFIWNEIDITVTFESDWKKAKEILINIINEGHQHLSKEAEQGVKKAAKKYMIFYNKLTPAVYTNIESNGIKFTMRYLCKPKQKRNSTHQILEQVLTSFENEPKIDFAYPTTRFFNK